ncbi:TLC domain-containing protein At5g14285-like [Diospyros lotus]|uniref:TLC domain-containing protein At5g14285-like n=1 Tax=Diospyros lotus TaxID=55363 RepID=UPI002256DFA2|nr:TLC domain-containing protein At5g14285-like [Diospyros lotus]
MEAVVGVGVDAPTLAVFFLMFVAIYLLGYLTIFRRWGGVSRPEASSCLISLAHGTPAVVLAVFSTLPHRQNQNPHPFSSANTAFQNQVLEYSIAYFLTDLFHYLLFVPADAIFVGHHLATAYVLITCRYIIHHGAFAILSLLAIAEVTSGCQNAWTLARLRHAASPEAAVIYEFLSPVFYSFYSVVRGVIGPLFVYKMGVFYSGGGAGDLIPKWAWISWMVLIVAAILVSILWVSRLWVDFYSRRRRSIRKSFFFGGFSNNPKSS